MSAAELRNVLENAVLTPEARDVLLEVMQEKQNTDEMKKRLSEAVAAGDFSELGPQEIALLAKQIILTTETSPSDIPIAKRLEIITAECVYGMNLFHDMFMSISDTFGGRSKTAQKTLRNARKTCLAELKREALMIGADAVVGVNLDYNEISSGKSGMLFLVASGTAVKLRKKAPTN